MSRCIWSSKSPQSEHVVNVLTAGCRLGDANDNDDVFHPCQPQRGCAQRSVAGRTPVSGERRN